MRLVLPGLCLVWQAAVADTSVWKISNATDSVYLAGTIHALAPSDYPLPAAYNIAYQNSQLVYVEVDIASLALADFQVLLQQLTRFPEGTELSDKITPQTWADLREFASSYGFSADVINQLRPGAVMMMLLNTEMQKSGVTAEGIDKYFYDRSVGDGRRVLAFETAEQQAHMIGALGEGDEDAFVRYLVSDLAEFQSQFDDLREAWRHGDNQQLVETAGVSDLKRDDPDTYNRLLKDRNEQWLPVIEKMFKTAEVEFILVGTMHLVGEDGLLNSLQRRGYRLQQLQEH